MCRSSSSRRNGCRPALTGGGGSTIGGRSSFANTSWRPATGRFAASRRESFMEFSVRDGRPRKQRTGCIVVGVYEGRKLSPSAIELDTVSGHALTDVVKKRGDLDGRLGTTLLLHDVPKVAAERVL